MKNEPQIENKKVGTRYYILAHYSYYYGTFYAPVNGALKDTYTGERIEFDSKADAEAYLVEPVDEFGDGMGCSKNIDGSYSLSGPYHTNHGEYSRPIYRIRKVRS